MSDHNPSIYTPIPLWTRDQVIQQLKYEGWIVCAPYRVPMPRNRKEAEGMHLASEAYLKNNTPAPGSAQTEE